MYWGKPHFELRVNGKAITPPPLDLIVRQVWGENTMMFARVHHYWYQANNVEVLPEDTLVEVRWGTLPDDIITWYGYVHHADVDTSARDRNTNVEVNYVLIGTGHLMTDQRRKTWKNQTDSGIAREIARTYNLSSVVHKTSKVYPWLLQDGESDMAFLMRRSKEVGRKFWVENGVLYFIDPAAWAAGKAIYTPEFDMHKNPNQSMDILRFSAKVGGDMPQTGRQYRRAIHGIDHQTGKLIKNKNADEQKARKDVLSYTRADSYEDLNYQLDGHTITTQEWIGGEAQLMGSTQLSPGQPINLKGRVVPQELQGMWMIVAADHSLRAYGTTNVGTSLFATKVTLARNAKDTYNTSDMTMPRINEDCTPSSDGWKAAQMQEITL